MDEEVGGIAHWVTGQFNAAKPIGVEPKCSAIGSTVVGAVCPPPVEQGQCVVCWLVHLLHPAVCLGECGVTVVVEDDFGIFLDCVFWY